MLSSHLEYFLLGTFRPEDSVKREVDLSRVLDTDFLRVIWEVGDERTARGLRRWGLAAGIALRRQACLGGPVYGGGMFEACYLDIRQRRIERFQ